MSTFLLLTFPAGPQVGGENGHSEHGFCKYDSRVITMSIIGDLNVLSVFKCAVEITDLLLMFAVTLKKAEDQGKFLIAS